jgi:hypothetical protein
MDTASKAKVARRIDDWKLKLIDLSRRNKLINFTAPKSSSLQITKPSIDNVFERLVLKSRAWEIWAPSDRPNRKDNPPIRRRRRTQLSTSLEDSKQIERVLKNLARRSTSEYRERGVRILYLTFGLLNWKDPITNQPVRSPIILTPVEIFRKTSRDPFKIQIPSVEEEVILNPALKLKLYYDHRIEIPPLPDYEKVKIGEYLKSIEESLNGKEWKLDSTIHLGLFSFQKLVMYQDLNDNKDRIAEHPIVQALAGVVKSPKNRKTLPKEEELDQIDPKHTFQILDADSSQQLCIQYALEGQSFVMHGPPGTGKSQTISNLISEFIANGKSVLFISEKMAALEVVYNRLKAKNLDEYCLELHSQKANKREVVGELNRCLTEHLQELKALTEEELDRLVNRRNQLNTYVESLHKPRTSINLTAFQLLSNISKLEEIPFIPTDYPHFKSLDQGKLLELEDTVRKLSNTWTVIEEGESFPWTGCMEDNYTPETRSNWVHLLDSTLKTLEDMIDDSSVYSQALGLSIPNTIRDYELLQTLSNIISASPRPPKNWFKEADLDKIQAQTNEFEKQWNNYWMKTWRLRRRYDARFLTLPPGTAKSVELAWNNLSEWLILGANGEGELYQKRIQLRRYLESLPDTLQESRTIAKEISEVLGIKKEIFTLEWGLRINEIAELCKVKIRPPRRWLEKKASENVKQILEEQRKIYSQKQSFEDKLNNYQAAFHSLDIESLIVYFEGPGKSIFRFLSPTYYRNRRLITSSTKNKKLPDTFIQDLKTAKKIQDQNDKIAQNQEKNKKILGPYFNEKPRLEEAEKALKTALRVVKILGKSRVPKALRDNLCQGTDPNKKLIEESLILKGLLSKLRRDSSKLRKILPKQMPNTSKTLRKSTISDVQDWAYEAQERLTQLEKVGAQALVTVIDDSELTYPNLITDLKTMENLQDFEDNVQEKSSELVENYGSLFNGLKTDWKIVKNAIGWTSKLLKTLPKGVPERLVKAVSQGDGTLPTDPKITERWDKISRNILDIKSRFKPPLWSNPKETLNLNEFKKSIQVYRTRIDGLQYWVDFKSLITKLEEEGLRDFIDRLVTEKTNRHLVVPVFQKAMYQGLLDMVFEEDQVLKDFRGKDHEQLIKDFQSLDLQFIQLSAQRIIENVNKQKPQGVFVQTPDSEITILMREAAKKRRHMPLRNLFERIPNLIRRLKPCLMMSPISVSQFLIPGSIQFDLVVFDEASQIFTEDAIGSIYRGNQLVVAGDPKQLPPTPFFQYVLSDDFDWDEESYDFDLFDSVLDECMSIGLPVQMLKWHYRSKHDSLISFSNERYYDGRLVLFPASHMGAEDLGVELVYVEDGIYNRGRTRDNPVEAEIITDLVFDHFVSYPEKTLGVVTFSIAQMNKVQDSVEQRLREHPEFEKFFVENRLNGFFVKNLENVQGDERDVMIFSVGYGYDNEGRLTMNFGPLNKPGGERRFNVAITRAREKVLIVSSLRYDDIKLDSSKAEGVHSLHHYLRYTEKRPKKLEAEQTDLLYGSALEQEVSAEIGKMGYKTIPQIGSSSFRIDLGVIDSNDPSRFILGIMLDGNNYRTASTSRDRDRLRLQVLENLGWRIHKIWSPDWVQRRQLEVKRLEAAIKKAENNPKLKTSIKKPKIQLNNTFTKLKVQEKPGRQLPEVEPYTLAKLKPRRFFNLSKPKNNDRYIRQYRSEIRRLLPQLVQIEAPIHQDLAYKRINKTLKIKRRTATIKEAYQDEMKKLGKKKIKIKGEFLWRKHNERSQIRVPVKEERETFREIQHIPMEETRAAILLVAKHSMGLSEESLIKETAQLLGFKKVGSKIRHSLRNAYQISEKSGKLITENSLIKYVY